MKKIIIEIEVDIEDCEEYQSASQGDREQWIKFELGASPVMSEKNPLDGCTLLDATLIRSITHIS